MSDTKSFTYSQVAEHTTKKDLYMVVHDSVYNVSSFVDEHPGGEEVLLDVAGQNATDAFEDVGHSDEAREILQGLFVGELKRQEGDPAPKSTSQQVTETRASSSGSGMGMGIWLVFAVGGAVAYYTYQYMQQQQTKA